jgi:glycosyltransferase involved in cell wall biosynthesis
MRVLTVTTMFPNRAQPVHAVFVKNRVLRVAKRCEVQVVSPIPWFPGGGWLKKYAHRSRIPRRDVIDGVTVHYPRFLSFPGILKPLDGLFLFLCLWWLGRKLRRAFPFDLIDAHLAFPDGFGAVLLGRLLRKPVTITLRGHDINDLPRHPVRRRQVCHALREAQRVIAVAGALRRGALELGAPPGRSEVISNGVDAELFFPADRTAARRQLGLPLDRRIVVAVGHLVERKGFHLIVEALARLRQAGEVVPLLVIVGAPGEEGDYSAVIRATIRRSSCEADVLLAGAQPNEALRDWYNAADVSCLASSKEGWANVLLESLACGTPVVATRVWGTPEVISSDAYGLLVDRTPESIASGLALALARAWDRQAMVDYARSQSWDAVADRVVRAFQAARDDYQAALVEPSTRAAEVGEHPRGQHVR